jgi:hypothetical protein
MKDRLGEAEATRLGRRRRDRRNRTNTPRSASQPALRTAPFVVAPRTT